MLYGTVVHPDGTPYADASVEVKAEDFTTLYSATTDENGHYTIDLPDGRYPFVIAVKDYAQQYLEYWAQNVPVSGPTQLDMRFDSLEVYGLNAFRVKGGYPSLHLYFRPMSLDKFRAGAEDIAPDAINIRVLIDQRPVELLQCSKVSEFIGDRSLTAYLIQVSLPQDIDAWHRADVMITDADGHFGMATIFS